MADTIKSALFVDYDSLHRSLGATSKEAAERLAQRSSLWVAAIESGRLLTPKGTAARRRVLIRRCYSDPNLLGKSRIAFIAGGFEVIDTPPLEGRERNSADIHMLLDAVDALEHPTGYDEFILIAADTDLTPLLLRLRAHNRTTVIYASQSTPADYRAIPDAVIDEAPLAQLLVSEEAPVAAESEAPATGARPAAADKSDIEVLARKVHNATSVPLFSPRSYADLFRILAQEIAENGYHFQNTAENVAGKLAAVGRNVTRRQILFVVKGLALKGHVFSTTDSAERLAEVFREQVLYLVGNQGIALEPREQALLPSWIVGKVSPAIAAEPEPEPPKPAEDTKARKRAKPPVPQKASAPVPLPPAPSAAAPPTAPVVAAAPLSAAAGNGVGRPTPGAPRSIEEIKAAATARLNAMRPPPTQPKAAPPATARLAATQPRPAPTPVRTAPPTAPSQRPAQPVARPLTAARPTAMARPTPVTAKLPAAGRLTGDPAPEANKQALESSILAAIAQAVDVLVEDSGGTPSRREPPPAPPMTSPKRPEAKPEPVPSDGGGGDDIGDEIQRIIASYSRARRQGEPH